MTLENKISKNKNTLIVLPDTHYQSNEWQDLIQNFCGTVTHDIQCLTHSNQNQQIYVVGDIETLPHHSNPIFIIQEFSSNYELKTTVNKTIITLGEVPIIVENAGVYFKHFFKDKDYFNTIKSEHQFQALTESNKASKALRKGIYLSEITKNEKEQLHFQLLRCSSNLTGPTDNFRTTDHQIMTALNTMAKQTFEADTKLNHVLAQIYENKQANDGKKKQVKAKISAHSDKTKDMPKTGLIAFCTFYDNSEFSLLKPSKTDSYDWCYNKTSGLTRLHFKLKDGITDESLAKTFTVTLYPNSVFIIPLSTNRLYTHAIKPSILDIDKIPTRMGYVARCSNLEAIYTDEQTHIKTEEGWVKLEKMTPQTMTDLRDTYYEENISKQHVNYGKVYFSMNSGDYKKPIY